MVVGVLKHPDTAIHVLQLGLIVKAETTSNPANIKNRTCDINNYNAIMHAFAWRFVDTL